MKAIYTFIAFLFAMGLGAFIYFYEARQMTTDEWKEKKELLFNVKPADISAMSIEGANGRMELSKSGDLWLITSPLKTRADNALMESLVSRLTNARPVNRIKTGSGREDYGIGKPRLKFSFYAAQNQTKILFGNTAWDNKYVYIKINEKNEIQVVDKDIFENLNKDVNAFRYRKIMDFKRYNISKMELVTGGKTTVFSKDKDNNWQISSPVQHRADSFKCDEFLDKLQALEVETFVEDSARDLFKYGLDKEGVSVRIFEKESSRGLFFGLEKDDKIYARKDGSADVYLVKKDIIERIVSDPDYFKEKEKK